jgi:hypothetical protein
MINISILVPEFAVMQAIADPQYLFSAANQFLLAGGRAALFQCSTGRTKGQCPG